MNPSSLFSLEGKTALVTGCVSGIGLAMATALAAAGADIIGISSSGNVSAVQQAVEAAGKTFRYYQLNLGDRPAIYETLEKIYIDQPRIDILVNNAGIIRRQPAAEHSDAFWDEVININLHAQFILARECGKRMIEQGKGKIIFTGSLLSFQGGINVPGYTASKSAVGGLVKALANEWAAKGVQVNGIVPGYIETNNTEALRNDPDRSQAILSRIPAGRWGLPEDFAGPTVFLASEASDYVHGTMLVVDGGWMGR